MFRLVDEDDRFNSKSLIFLYWCQKLFRMLLPRRGLNFFHQRLDRRSNSFCKNNNKVPSSSSSCNNNNNERTKITTKAYFKNFLSRWQQYLKRNGAFSFIFWPFHGLFLAIRSFFIAFSRPLLAFSSLFIAFPRPPYGSFHGLFLAFPQSLLGPFRTGLFKMLSFPSMLKSVTKFWSITITFQKGRVDMWSRGQLGENIGQVCHQNWYSNWVLSSVTRKKSPNVYKSLPKMISL